MPINSWDELHERQLVPLPNGSARWVGWRELRSEATPRFRRVYDRHMRRVDRQIDVFLYGDPQRMWQVSTRKYKARKGKK